MLNQIGPASATLFAPILIASVLALWVVPGWLERLAFRSYNLQRGRDYFTPITSGFLHADFPHLLFNGITFYFFAIPLERQIGTGKFLLLYFVGLLVSQATTFFKHRDKPQYATPSSRGSHGAHIVRAGALHPEDAVSRWHHPHCA